jgi:methyltransferase (TIGR00027 family)
MKPGEPSRTAEYMAFFRACESARPQRERLFNDPFAACFLHPSLRAGARISKLPWLARLVGWYADRRLPGARTSAIARTRLIDDAVGEALRKDIRQLVILGAGFDCRPYRLPELATASIYEVDHPSTFEIKRARLRQVLPAIPGNVHFVQIDFNRESLPQMLREAGFDCSLRSVFLWEGVTNYLTPYAVDSVLHFVSGCSPQTRLIFTYVHSGAINGSVNFEGAPKVLDDVTRIGEPWTFGLDPDSVAEFLGQRGFRLVLDSSARQYRARYFGPAAERMNGYDFYHVAIADVSAKGQQSTAGQKLGSSTDSYA